MKAIELKDFGGPEQLVETDFPKPVAQRGQVVVRIHATSLNPIDPKRASGHMRQIFPVIFPFIPGGDFSGTVDSIGENVVGYELGDEVWGDSAAAGAYAEYLAIHVDQIARKPRNLTFVEAASLALVAQTAQQALDHANLQPGQTILIHGAGGAVGSAAVQLAHTLGARVIASASPGSFERLRSYGADQLIDYKTTRFESAVKDVDVVLDGVGGETQQRSYAVLKRGGILVAISQPPNTDEAAKYGVRAMMFSTQDSPETLNQLTTEIEAGRLKPYVVKTYPLSEIPQAWRDSATERTTGKVVFVIVP
jgi:NADPH:quinone reductase-like Zn-dependent oxidoreductase